MKQILINDSTIFKKILKKACIIYFLPLIIFSFTLYFQKNINTFSILNILSLNIDISNFQLLEFILFILNIFIHIYMVYFLFYNDIKKGICNFLLRINSKKYIFYKLLSIFFYNFLLLLFPFIIFCGFLILYKFNLNFILKLKMILYFYNIELIFLLTYIFNSKYSILLFLLFLILLILFNFINILNINLFLLFFLAIIIAFTIYLIFKKNFHQIFETIY